MERSITEILVSFPDGYEFLVTLVENIIYEDDIFEDIYWMGTNSSAGRAGVFTEL